MERDEAYRKAKQRAAAKFSFFIHLAVYVIVNGVLIIINVSTNRTHYWFLWPMMGWGIGLFFHCIGVFVGPWAMKRMIAGELKKEQGSGRR